MTANTTARMMSMSACAEENDVAGTAWSVFLEFCVMKVKRVEEVAFTYFGNKVVFRLGDSFLAQGAILVDILVGSHFRKC